VTPPPSSTTGVLLVNLGTPDEPTAPALRRYLGEFLADPRVVEIPRWLWWPVLHGVILRVRPAKSAAKYASIWTPEGSPLKVWTERQARLLLGALGERGLAVKVRHAMRYGQPSIASQLDALRSEGVGQVLVLPLYPQYSCTTTASVIDAVGDWARRQRAIPELRFVNRYPQERGYLDAVAGRLQRHWAEHGLPERLVLSFHGVPERTRLLGDPYFDDCQATARGLADRLALPEGRLLVTFQSRFGKAKWLQPYTEPTVRSLAREGVRRLDVACPGFTGDCLETLEEIGMEVRQAFLEEGGKDFHYIPCVNDDPRWIRALADLAERHLAGWPARRLPPSEGAPLPP
jgi:ferrochelatase